MNEIVKVIIPVPRDFYDIWYLSQNAPDLDWQKIVEAFHQKMEFKDLKFISIDQMINDENDKRLQAAWKNSLGHQISPDNFPEYKVIKPDILELLKRIF